MNIVYNDKGKATETMGVTRDITDRKVTEEALRNSEERYRLLVENAHEAIYVAQDEIIKFCNSKTLELLGCSQEEVLFKKFVNHIHPEDRDMVFDRHRRRIQGEVIPSVYSFRLLDKDGMTKWVEVNDILISWEGRPATQNFLSDITKRKLTEEALRKSEERYRTIFENTGNPSTLFNETSTLLLVNTNFEKLSGYSRKEIENKMSWADFVDQEDLVKMRQYHKLRGMGSGSAPESYEFRFINRNREVRDIFLNIAIIPETKERIASLIDITERKRTEKALQESENRFRALAENSEDTIMRFDRHHRHLYVNPIVYRETGIEPELFIGKTHREMGFPEDLCILWESAIDKVFKTGEVNGLEFMLPKGIWIDWLLAPETDAQGKVIAVVTSSRDITERKRAEEELRKEKEFSETLIQSSPAFFVAISPEGKTIMMNDSLLRALGYTKEEIVDIDYLNTFIPESERQMLEEVFGTIVQSKITTINENHILTRDGRTHLVEWQGIPVFHETGELDYFFIVGMDITERKRAEEEKKRLESQLAQAQKMESIGTLAGGIAHDFNNILSAIIGYSELALEDVSDPEKAKVEIREVIKAGDRAKDLVSQILTFSRETETSYSPLELPTLIKESLKMLRSVIPRTIEIRHDIIKSGLINSDPTQIHQLMMNLCINAAHAMDENGGVLSVILDTVHVNDDASEPNIAHGSYLKLSISDTGHGMTPEVMEKIFEPYFTTKELGRGTGLGLSVVHGIVKSHGGVITCESTPGKGTTFNIYLPELVIGTEVHKSTIEETLPVGTERILYIDDEPALTSLAEKMLSKLGYDVTTMTSSHGALNIFKARPDAFDLVITDMTMPGMTGDRVAQNFLEIRQDIPIIICSGYSEHISQEKAKSIGIRKFVMKPLEMRELAMTIRKVLDAMK